MQQHSGLQKQVLNLYRRCLRAANKKEDSERSIKFVKEQFRKNSNEIDRKEFQRIEYYIRKGEKQLKVLSNPNVKGIGY